MNFKNRFHVEKLFYLSSSIFLLSHQIKIVKIKWLLFRILFKIINNIQS